MRAIRVSTLGVLPLAIQYTVVDGFTGMGIAKVAITLSLFRKFIYFASVVAVPVLTRVTNVFYAETISDFAGSGDFPRSCSSVCLSGLLGIRRLLGEQKKPDDGKKQAFAARTTAKVWLLSGHSRA